MHCKNSIDLSQLEPVVPEPEDPCIRNIRGSVLDRAVKAMVRYRDSQGQFCGFWNPDKKSQFMVVRPFTVKDHIKVKELNNAKDKEKSGGQPD